MSTRASSKAASLDEVYESLHKLLSRYAPPLKASGGTVRAKRNFHLTVPKADGPRRVWGQADRARHGQDHPQKGYVGLYFMPIYANPALKNKLPPSLNKLLKGKTCFHIKKLDPDLLRNIEAALNEGMKCYEGLGWV